MELLYVSFFHCRGTETLLIYSVDLLSCNVDLSLKLVVVDFFQVLCGFYIIYGHTICVCGQLHLMFSNVHVIYLFSCLIALVVKC